MVSYAVLLQSLPKNQAWQDLLDWVTPNEYGVNASQNARYSLLTTKRLLNALDDCFETQVVNACRTRCWSGSSSATPRT